MEDQLDLHAELAALRRQLADATATAGAHRKQLAEAKAKAKAIIQRKVDEADAKISVLEDQNKLQAEELVTLKDMMRQLDDQRNALSDTCNNLHTQLRNVQSQNTDLQHRCSSLEADLTDARKSASKLTSTSQQKEAQLRSELASLRSELSSFDRSKLETVSNGADVEDVAEELNNAKQSVHQLVTERDQLQAENKSLREAANAKPEASNRDPTDSPSKVSALWEETRQSKECIEDLSRQLEEAKRVAETKRTEYENSIQKIEAKNISLKEEVTAGKARVNGLLQDLQKSELALQEERENVTQERKSRSENATQEGEEKNKLLEAKVSEMERVVASKQAEIGKVREKAKTYLRELNAEKRAMETKMKEEADHLQRELEDERKRVEAAERRAESASAELDNCLALIRDKQKSVQILKMTISTQKSSAEEAARENKSLREEFCRYKERARLALREKDTEAESVEAKVEVATAALHRDMETAQKESRHLKARLRQLEDIQRKYGEVLERAERAEAAADLLRRDATGVSNTNYSRVDALEEQLSAMEGELNATRVAMEDAEAKLETTSMRLEATEKALRGAEVRAEETERISQKTIEGHRSQVTSLEKELARAHESAASAQRTAAAAAKALALSSSETGEEFSKPDSKQPGTPVDRETRKVSNISIFGSPNSMKAGQTTFAAAMAGHSDGFGLRASFDSQSSSSQVLDSELRMKDQHIMVLTTQIAELGALLEDVQHDSELRAEQTSLLKEEVKNLDAKLAAAEKLQNGAPFSYLRTIVVRYLETDDATLLPVIANVLSFSEEETVRVKDRRGTKALSSPSPKGGYFGLNGLLGSGR